jgi:hypothetical protein
MQAVYALADQDSAISLDSLDIVLRVSNTLPVLKFGNLDLIMRSAGNVAVTGHFQLPKHPSTIN